MHPSRSSRRHTSNPISRRLSRAVVAALSVALVVGALLPALAFAQDRDAARDLEHKWQLLTYRAANGSEEPVPAGIGATVLPFGGEDAWGEAACSTYETTYNVQGSNLFIDPTEPAYVECDAASREFDEIFYELLFDTASFTQSGSILILKDAIGERLLVFTRAKIDEDPTAARWDLARIGDADGSVEPAIAHLSSWIEFLLGGRIVGSTGCGSFFGDYETNKGVIDITDVRYRLHACADGAAAQAEKIVATLDEIAAFEVLPAGLRLQDANGTTRLALTPVIELDSRTWTPTVVYDAKGQTLAEGLELSTSAVKLHAQTADGGSICRPFTARGLRSGLALNIGNLKYAKKSKKCPAPKNDNAVDQPAVEKAFVDGLRATASHALRGSELEFKDVAGNTLMLLEPQEELVGPTWVVDWLGRRRTKVIGDEQLTATFTDAGLVIGSTGVVTQGTTNSYIADFELLQATRIDISNVEAQSNRCSGAKQQKKAICKQERTFLTLLEQVDRYIAREGDLKLYRGTDDVMRLVPQHLVTAEE